MSGVLSIASKSNVKLSKNSMMLAKKLPLTIRKKKEEKWKLVFFFPASKVTDEKCSFSPTLFCAKFSIRSRNHSSNLHIFPKLRLSEIKLS